MYINHNGMATNVANGGRKLWWDILAANLPEGEHLRVLDVGTGPGFFAILLAEMGHAVTAVDYTPAMLEDAIRCQRFSLSVGS